MWPSFAIPKGRVVAFQVPNMSAGQAAQGVARAFAVLPVSSSSLIPTPLLLGV